MGSYTTSLDELTAAGREDVVRHLEQTYHLNYGSIERQDMIFFRCGLADVQSPAAPAVFLRDLIAAVRDDGPVRVQLPARKPDQYRVAELLGQSARRAALQVSGAYGAAAAAVLARMTQEWDTQRKLSTNELERAEWVALPA